jgi:hypothetical protein
VHQQQVRWVTVDNALLFHSVWDAEYLSEGHPADGHFEMEPSGIASENDYQPPTLIEKSEMLKQYLDRNSWYDI